MKKLGSINACNLLTLFDKDNKVIGNCLDTPNAFAKCCANNKHIVKGVAHYQLFGDTIRLRDDSDIQDRIKMYM